jgi:hypothetical protein|nr:MAG TPA: hypothetical protein [Caudoviricetes sp.]
MSPLFSIQETSFKSRLRGEKGVFESSFLEFRAKKRGQRLIRYKKAGG